MKCVLIILGLTAFLKLIYNRPMIRFIAALVVALLLMVLAGFIALPASRRLIRNISLTRKGSIATGHYLHSTKVAFFLPTKRRIEFVTWRNSSAKSKEVEVLYHPEVPEQAEVRSSKMLWFRPADELALAVGLVAMACALVLGVNYALALCFFVACVLALWLLVRIALVTLVLLSVRYTSFSRVGMHILAGFQITRKQNTKL